MMEKTLEQRYAIKFCVKLKKTPLETFEMLKEAFGDDCLSKSQSNRWHKMFRKGWEEVADEARAGRQPFSASPIIPTSSEHSFDSLNSVTGAHESHGRPFAMLTDVLRRPRRRPPPDLL